MSLNAADLRQFTGTQEYHYLSSQFQNIILTDGAKYVAENGGEQGAYWLLEAIASYQPEVAKKADLHSFQLWTLKVKDHKGILTCQADSDRKPFVTQHIEYTDFDLPKIELYCLFYDSFRRVILLPSEY